MSGAAIPLQKAALTLIATKRKAREHLGWGIPRGLPRRSPSVYYV